MCYSIVFRCERARTSPQACAGGLLFNQKRSRAPLSENGFIRGTDSRFSVPTFACDRRLIGALSGPKLSRVTKQRPPRPPTTAGKLPFVLVSRSKCVYY